MITFSHQQLPYRVEWNFDSQQYVATCDSFPGLSAIYETVNEALRQIMKTVEMYYDPHIFQFIADECAKLDAVVGAYYTSGTIFIENNTTTYDDDLMGKMIDIEGKVMDKGMYLHFEYHAPFTHLNLLTLYEKSAGK